MVIPKNWSQVTVAKYQQAYKIIKSQDYDSDTEKLIDIALVFGDIKLSDFKLSVLNELRFIFDTSTINTKVIETIGFKGRYYRFNTDITKMTAGQYIDLSTYTTDDDTIINNLHTLLAIIATERRWLFWHTKYSAEAVSRRAEVFKDLPMTVAYPITLFFCSVLINLTPHLRSSLMTMGMKAMSELPNSANIGDG
jgi:hypothetical protein